MQQYWLFKSEPFKFSWEMMKAAGREGTQWDGVRNYQARNNMRAMEIGDLGFFYHHDTTSDDPRWECVDVRAVKNMPKPISLEAIKVNPALSDMVLVGNSRLSVQPVRPEEWQEVCRMGGLDPAP